ncbi:nucleotidyltransferase domain-containing protein [Desulfobacula sp.]|uniref:nucleotidyltransferase family protein n=1 Tax=Desulfobacula sp. TaxID=2593537 RepID=UPI0034495A61
MFGIEKHIIKMILSEMSNHSEVCDIIIFGSRAKGNFKKGSDIDLAIKGKNISFELVAGLKTSFNQKLLIPYHVDIVHYESISNKDLIDHIDRIGISLLR